MGELDGVYIFTNLSDLINFVLGTIHNHHEAQDVDSEFWRIVENGYYEKDHDTNLPGTD